MGVRQQRPRRQALYKSAAAHRGALVAARCGCGGGQVPARLERGSRAADLSAALAVRLLASFVALQVAFVDCATAGV